MYKPKIQMGTSSCIISVFDRIILGKHQNLSRHRVWNVSPDTFTLNFNSTLVSQRSKPPQVKIAVHPRLI